MKKLINDPADVVRDALRGMAAAHPELRVDLDERIVVRADAPTQGKVGLVSGGGSGHEPLHAGFVGPGMLDAAVPGEVFTSPVPDQILAATKAVSGGAGVRARGEELHRRRAQLPARRRARRRRGHQGRVGAGQRRRRGAGQPLHRRPAGHRSHGRGGEGGRRAGRAGRGAGPGGRGRPEGQRGQPQLRHRADRRARRPPPARPPSISAPTRSSSASASTASRAGSGARSGRPPSWPRSPRPRSSRTCRSTAATTRW